MSAAAAAADAPAPAGGGKKKLIIIIVAAVLVLALGGVGAMMMLKKKPAEGEEEAEAAAKAPPKPVATTKHDPKKPPAYVPLDMFVVNLADRDAERYAQIGVTLEIDDAKTAEAIKAFLPAVRNNILMVLAHKNSSELVGREGKLKLAGEVQRAAVRAMGVQVDEPEEEEAESSDEEKPKKSKKKKKKKVVEPYLPVTAVHFSTFIVQ